MAQQVLADRRTVILISSIVALLSLVAFLPAWNNGWVEWDDNRNFLTNTHFQGLGLKQLAWAWQTFLLGVYQPMAWHLLSLQSSVVGLAPRGYHVASALMHAANSVALFGLTLGILGRRLPELRRGHSTGFYLSAAAATTLYAVHPLRVEAVAWVSCQPYLPCTFFYLLSISAYVHAFGAKETRTRWLAISYACFVAALLFKAAAVSLPFILLIVDIYVLERLTAPSRAWLTPPQRQVLFEKVPFFVTSGVAMIVAIVAKRHSSVGDVIEHSSLVTSSQIAQAAYGVWFYLLKTLWPTHLSAYYVVPSDLSWTQPRFLFAIVAFVAVTAALVALRHRWPSVLAAWCGYLVILAPNLGLVNISKQIAADRYSYVPMLALTILAAGILLQLLARLQGKRAATAALVGGFAAATGLLTYLSQEQTRVWRSSVELWESAIANGTGNEEVYNFLGLAYAQSGRIHEAEDRFRESLRLNPRYAEVHNNLGTMYAQSGNLADAEDEFRRTLSIRPHSEAHNNLGSIYLLRRDTSAAIGEFVEALRVDPDNQIARDSLDRALNAEADARLAIAAEDFAQDPNDARAYARVIEILRAGTGASSPGR